MSNDMCCGGLGLNLGVSRFVHSLIKSLKGFKIRSSLKLVDRYLTSLSILFQIIYVIPIVMYLSPLVPKLKFPSFIILFIFLIFSEVGIV